jgi:tetratricopeptide (TPR) repeat protein
MNWLVHREFVPFERGESTGLVIMSALGYVGPDYSGTDLGDRVVGEVVGRIGSRSSAAVLSWAAVEVLSHPLRFARAFVARGGLIASHHPVLFVLAIALLAVHRRRREFAAAGLVAAYFFGVHCFLPYYGEYYSPLWVLLIVIACSGLALAPGLPAPARWESRAAHAGLTGALALALALSGWTMFVVWRYGSAMPSRVGPALERALTERPDERWLLAEAGIRAVEEGRAEEADARLRRALDGGVQYPRWRLYSAWARALRGDLEPLFGDRMIQDMGADLTPHAMRAYARLKSGNSGAAQRELARGLSSNEEGQGNFYIGVDEPARSLLFLQRRRLKWRDLESCSFELLKPAPERERDAFLSALMQAGRDAFAEEARSAQPPVQEEVRRFRDEIEGTRWEWLHRAALARQNEGECGPALELFDRLCRERPTARYFSDRAVCESKTGATAKATADLERAVRMDPGFLPAYVSLATIYAQGGRNAEAADVCDRGLSQPGGGQGELRRLLRQLRSEALGRGRS